MSISIFLFHHYVSTLCANWAKPMSRNIDYSLDTNKCIGSMFLIFLSFGIFSFLMASLFQFFTFTLSFLRWPQTLQEGFSLTQLWTNSGQTIFQLGHKFDFFVSALMQVKNFYWQHFGSSKTTDNMKRAADYKVATSLDSRTVVHH